MKHLLILFLSFFGVATIQSLNAQEFGLASFYSDKFHGRKTAYEKIYDKNKLTCAHKRHPLGTRLRVTRMDNKKSVVVTVIDKGPYIAGKIIDLSRAAAERIDLIDDGVTEVKVEVIGKVDMSGENNSVAVVTEERGNIPTSFEDTSPIVSPSNNTTAQNNKVTTKPQSPAAKPETKKTTPQTNNANNTSSSLKNFTTQNQNARNQPSVPKTIELKPSSPDRARLVGKDYTKYGLYKIQLMRPEVKGYGVQVVSLSNYENVLKSVADFQARGFSNVYINIEPGTTRPIYKIILGMYDNEASANRYKNDLKNKYKITGFVVSFIE